MISFMDRLEKKNRKIIRTCAFSILLGSDTLMPTLTYVLGVSGPRVTKDTLYYDQPLTAKYKILMCIAEYLLIAFFNLALTSG